MKVDNYQNIEFSVENNIAHLKLNRPQVCNAFNEELIAEVRASISFVKNNSNIRILVMSGGKHFCAGGDIAWMQRSQSYSYQKHYDEMFQISCMFDDIYTLPIPVIAQVNGAAIGGGAGFIAASDIAIASENSIFSISETKSGLVPACIMAYLVSKITPASLTRYFLTGEKFDAFVAKNIGLIHEVCPQDKLKLEVDKMCSSLLECAPGSLSMAKELLRSVPQMRYEDFLKYGAEKVTQMRMSEEGQEGFQAFLEKRKPKWNK